MRLRGTLYCGVFFPPETPEDLLRGTGGSKNDNAAFWFAENYERAVSGAIALGFQPLDIEQKRREVVYIPPGWWHAVLNTEAIIAVTQNLAYCAAGDAEVLAAVHKAFREWDDESARQWWLWARFTKQQYQ